MRTMPDSRASFRMRDTVERDTRSAEAIASIFSLFT